MNEYLKLLLFNRYNEDLNKNAAINLDSDEESEEENTQKLKLDTGYDFKQFENLEVSSEVKECFQNILRCVSQLPYYIWKK